MKGFERKNQLFSLCGLNCGLCPMKIGGYCGGCGNGSQSCAVARCSVEHGGVEYCCFCPQYPCEKYDGIDDGDSFITHRRQKADLAKAAKIGIEQYNAEQEEKVKILKQLLNGYNDGRKKSLFCLAVNLLELPELQRRLEHIQSFAGQRDMTEKQKGALAADTLRRVADKKNIVLKLNRNRKKK